MRGRIARGKPAGLPPADLGGNVERDDAKPGQKPLYGKAMRVIRVRVPVWVEGWLEERGPTKSEAARQVILNAAEADKSEPQ